MYWVQFYRERLNQLLSAKRIQLSELSVIQASLEQEARVAKGNLKSLKWNVYLFFLYKTSCNLEKEKTVKLKWDYLSELKSELERIHFQHVTLHDRISSVAGKLAHKGEM